MNDMNVVDRFLETFIQYIDSGFGLLNGDVAYLTTVLIGIDITLAGLFWSLDTNGLVIGRLIKKVLYIGAFAFIIDNFSILADIIFRSFASLGLDVTNNGLTAADLLRPGRLASVGYEAAWPLLEQARTMLRFTTFFDNLIPALVLFFAWLIVILAFFILAMQLFITVLEFKLTTLAGFVLVPFALWNKSAFLAERVLGNVVSSGVKVMVLAVVVGIGAGFFSDFVNALSGQDPNLGQAMSLVLAAISFFGIGIFGPGIASGLVSGAPQLGAGAAIGTTGALMGGAALAGAGTMGAARMIGSGGFAAVRAGTHVGAGASTAYELARATSGKDGIGGMAAGMAGLARAGVAAAGQRMATAVGPSGIRAGSQSAWRATGGSLSASPPSTADANQAPDWAKTLRSEQRQRTHRQATAQSIKDGDKQGGGANPDLSERES
ncbi:MAG: P-type conjugative transfer protein TrbL [Thiobacillus sp.]|nr:P-type conjugative transfer protein TrbL [Thiobacillus sp.]